MVFNDDELLVLFLLCVGVIGYAWMYRKQRGSCTGKAEGRITDVYFIKGGKGPHRTAVRYEYRVNGCTYTGGTAVADVSVFLQFCSFDKLREKALGHVIPVYYDPRHPEKHWAESDAVSWPTYLNHG